MLQKRIDNANKLINVISNCGRNFFKSTSESMPSSFITRSTSGRYYVIDHYTFHAVYMWDNKRWLNFSNGGGLKCFLLSLKRYIKTGDKLNFIVPMKYEGDGNIWGYDEESRLHVEYQAHRLGITK